MEKFLRKFALGLVKAFEKRVLPVWRYSVHNLAMVDFAQPRVRSTAVIELWLCSNQMAHPQSSVDNLGMFGCFEKFCFLYTYGLIIQDCNATPDFKKNNHICMCSTQKALSYPKTSSYACARENQF